MLIRSSELAEKLGVTKQTILTMTHNNMIPHYRLPRGHFRYDYEEVLAHMKRGNDRMESRRANVRGGGNNADER